MLTPRCHWVQSSGKAANWTWDAEKAARATQSGFKGLISCEPEAWCWALLKLNKSCLPEKGPETSVLSLRPCDHSCNLDMAGELVNDHRSALGSRKHTEDAGEGQELRQTWGEWILGFQQALSKCRHSPHKPWPFVSILTGVIESSGDGGFAWPHLLLCGASSVTPPSIPNPATCSSRNSQGPANAGLAPEMMWTKEYSFLI